MATTGYGQTLSNGHSSTEYAKKSPCRMTAWGRESYFRRDIEYAKSHRFGDCASLIDLVLLFFVAPQLYAEGIAFAGAVVRGEEAEVLLLTLLPTGRFWFKRSLAQGGYIIADKRHKRNRAHCLIKNNPEMGIVSS